MLAASVASQAEIRSYTIEFGAEYASTESLDNSNFTTAVANGRGYIESVTSVVNVFPEKNCIKLGSSKHDGKFNIHLTENASIIPEYYVVNAARHTSNRDAEASIMLNSETVYIDNTEFADYRIDIPAIAPQKISALTLDATKRVYIKSITVYYDSANGIVEPEKEQVAAPVMTPAGGTLASGSTITMTCATPDAEIRYTTDGSDPSASSQLYTSPLVLQADCYLSARAFKDGMQPSELTAAAFWIADQGNEVSAHFNFNEPATLTPAVAEPASKEWVALDGRSFSSSYASLAFSASDEGNTHVRIYHSYDAGCDLRIYDGDRLTVSTTSPSMYLARVVFELSESGSSDINFTTDCGEFDYYSSTWTPAEGDEPAASVVFTSDRQSRVKSITVYLKGVQGIPGLNYDRDEPATYYNINGIRIDSSNPTPGFYIRVTPSDATKVVVK